MAPKQQNQLSHHITHLATMRLDHIRCHVRCHQLVGTSRPRQRHPMVLPRRVSWFELIRRGQGWGRGCNVGKKVRACDTNIFESNDSPCDLGSMVGSMVRMELAPTPPPLGPYILQPISWLARPGRGNVIPWSSRGSSVGWTTFESNDSPCDLGSMVRFDGLGSMV